MNLSRVNPLSYGGVNPRYVKIGEYYIIIMSAKLT